MKIQCIEVGPRGGEGAVPGPGPSAPPLGQSGLAWSLWQQRLPAAGAPEAGGSGWAAAAPLNLGEEAVLRRRCPGAAARLSVGGGTGAGGRGKEEGTLPAGGRGAVWRPAGRKRRRAERTAMCPGVGVSPPGSFCVCCRCGRRCPARAAPVRRRRPRAARPAPDRAVRAVGTVRRGAGVGDGRGVEAQGSGVKQRPCFSGFTKS